MDLTNELRRQARRFRCEVCSQNMADCGIKVLDQKPSIALIRVTCKSCREETLFHVVFRTIDGDEAEHDEPVEIAVAEPDPITSDEMLDVHLALEGLRGGLSDLFPGDPSPQPAE